MALLASVLLALGSPNVTVVDKPSDNAWASATSITITESLVRRTTDAELAFIIAHEMAHQKLPRKKSRELELAADLLAVDIVIKAGFDPLVGARYLRRTDYFRGGGDSHFNNSFRASVIEAYIIKAATQLE